MRRQGGPAETEPAPRNRSKARVTIGPETVVKDYRDCPVLVRWMGRYWLDREERALRRLEGLPNVPTVVGRRGPYALEITRVPGVPVSGRRPPEVTERFIERLGQLFDALHARGVAHGDAHCRNVLMAGEEPYLVDFSTAWVTGRHPILDRFLFEWYKQLDRRKIYKLETDLFGRDVPPPRMFLLYRLVKEGALARFLKNLVLVVGILAILVLARPTRASLIGGGMVAALGQGIRIWAAGHLRRNREVTTSGPYAYVRDPLYLGRLLLLVGFGIMAWGPALWVLAVGVVLFLASYMPRKLAKEPERLENLFGEEYARYAAQVRSLLPRLTPYPERARRSWSFELFWRENREQYFLLGTLLVGAVLVWRHLAGS